MNQWTFFTPKYTFWPGSFLKPPPLHLEEIVFWSRRITNKRKKQKPISSYGYPIINQENSQILRKSVKMCFFAVKKNSKKNSVLAFQQFLQKKRINKWWKKMNWFACSKKFKEKNWCNNFDYNDRQCKNSVITKQCNSSARWQKQTNKQTIWWSSRKKIVLEKVTFSEKFRAGFMIFQYSMKMKKTL